MGKVQRCPLSNDRLACGCFRKCILAAQRPTVPAGPLGVSWMYMLTGGKMGGGSGGSGSRAVGGVAQGLL